ncbi:N-formylglutamate deformylase [Pseudooceanicola algae]|uniref:Uncharacterized protein n=1 Tax=Pseudooceanicola algae TaxID=1537215 RepID=A0A418SG58_9RHOB|nr:N-formylglutamate deformylase [Pseudooceanicola algae]QPM91663.1 hypothetical protein PSAL_029180 [Pseudooceanicola algae]
MRPVDSFAGDGPLVLGLPHCGTHVPDDILARFNPTGAALADTDWHVDRLYRDLLPGVSWARANFHRYVIDANRDPEGVSLYPGQNTTGLCPTTDFEGAPIYLPGQEPDADEITARLHAWHAPYHAALRGLIDRALAKHGVAILFDCHSIRSEIAFLFDGVLPDLNLGTNDGKSCAAPLQEAVTLVMRKAEGFSGVVNGRFKGGWTTRHYGQPGTGVHAIQLELAQKTHLAQEAAPFDYDTEKAARLRPVLQAMLEQLQALAPHLEEGKSHG